MRPVKSTGLGNFVNYFSTPALFNSIKNSLWISVFSTIIATPDNKKIIVPNGAIFGGTITNYNGYDTRRVDMVFGISYDDDLRKAKQLLADIIAADDRILAEPEPVIALSELAALVGGLDDTYALSIVAKDGYYPLTAEGCKEELQRIGVELELSSH